MTILAIAGILSFALLCNPTFWDVREYKLREARTNNVVRYLLWEDRTKEKLKGFWNNLLSGKPTDPCISDDYRNLDGARAAHYYGAYYDSNDPYTNPFTNPYSDAMDPYLYYASMDQGGYGAYDSFYDADEDMVHVRYRP